MISRLIILLTTLILTTGAAVCASAPPPLRDYQPTDPEFIARFLHHYLPNPATEPAISRSEQDLLRSVLPAIEPSPRQALDTLTRARTPESSAAIDYLIGNLHLQSGNVAQARSAYQQAIDKFPSFLRAHRNLGLLEIQNGAPAKALTHLRQALELGGASGETFGLIGYAHLSLDNPASAAVAYEQATLFQPDSRDWKTGLTQALMQSDRYEQAAAMLKELIKAYPDDPLLWQFQANLMIARDDTAAALTALEISRRLAPLPADALILLGELYYRSDVTEEAVNLWLAALQAAPDTTAPRLPTILSMLAANQQWDEFSNLLHNTPDTTLAILSPEQQDDITYLTATRDWRTGNSHAAAQSLQDLVERNPLHGPALLALAQIVRDQGDPETALLLLERASRRPDSRLNALLLQARILVDRNDFKAAIPILEQAAIIDPRPDIIRYTNAVREAHRNTGR